MNIDATMVGALIAGAATIAIYSYLYEENAVYRLAESLLIGLATGNVVAITWDAVRRAAFVPLVGGQVIWIIPIVLGMIMYLYFLKQYSYLYRIPLAFLVGVGTGLTIRGSVSANLIDQLVGTINADFSNPSNWLMLLGIVASTLYFVFTFGGQGKTGYYSQFHSRFSTLGRWFLMAAFGATFGNVVQGRISSAWGRVGSLLTPPAIYEVPIAIAIFVIYLIYRKRKHT